MKHFLQKAFLVLLGGVFFSLSASAQSPEPIYMLDFEGATTVSDIGGIQHGSGTLVTNTDSRFGTFYQNWPNAELNATATTTSNYLEVVPTKNPWQQLREKEGGLKEFSISFWCNATVSVAQRIGNYWGSLFTAYTDAGTSESREWYYILGPDLRYGGQFHYNNGGYVDNNHDTYIPEVIKWWGDYRWHHFAWVFSEIGETSTFVLTLYVDGVQKYSVTENVTDGFSMNMLNNLDRFVIGGASPIWADPDNAYAYDEIAIYDTALSSEQVGSIYSSKGAIEPPTSGTVIGELDNSTRWWTAFSDYFEVEANKTLTLKFDNYTNELFNGHNWVLVLTNDADRGDTDNGYEEYVVLRADHYGWGSKYNSDNLSSNYVWETFRQELDGANVEMTIAREGGKVTITAVQKATDGETVRTETYTFTDDNISENTLRAFLTTEGGHLILNETSTEDTYVAPEGLVGKEDNTTAWWTAFSDYYTIEPNYTLTLSFENYSDKADNVNNWLTFITTDADRDAEGYSEYVALQATGYGWQGELNTNNNESNWFKTNQYNYDWETFKDDMDGATVVLTIARMDADVLLTADVTTTENKKFRHYFVLPCGDGKQNIRAFLSTEKGHLILDKEATTIENTERLSYNKLIGLENNTTLFNTMFSDDFILKKNESVDLEFNNYTCGVQNWHNWVLFVTNDQDRGSTDYTEHVVLRADAFGLAGFDATKLTSENYPEDWTIFREDMNGANVKMNIKREGAKVTITATITGAVSGTEYKETYVDNYGDGEQNIRIFLSTECGHLDLLSAKISEDPASSISTIDAQNNATQDAPMFDLSGRRVDASYKGIVIQNGKKMIVK